ncbi:MAG TPA: divalent metal cation transporter [Blastocatellia bacterium]|nr:divalent metal cation transporter [Blastocatellia bacterium]
MSDDHITPRSGLPKTEPGPRPTSERPPHVPGPVRRFFADLGPGLITGAADDDPSGISTYSVAGASFGYGMLWTVIFSFPLMAGVQLMCARLGLVTGRGLAGVIRLRYPKYVLWGACALLVVANTINIGADLGGMAAALEMVTGVTRFVWLPLTAGLIVVLLIWSRYRYIARVFKWLTLVLFAYVICAFFTHQDWAAVLRATFVPHVEWNRRYLATFVAILGTTISPYLFFWQAAQEVEEEREMGRRTVRARRGATDEELRTARRDVVAGMAFAIAIEYFIILTTSATLFATGQREIETAQQAAEALRPLAHEAAYLLFTLGLVGTGMLAVPVLAGSAAYAVSEAMRWGGGLDERPRLARKFYGVLAAAVLVGLGLDYMRFNAVRMLFWAAVVNGVLAPPLIVIVTHLTADPKVMGGRANPPLLSWLGWATAGIMFAATVAMIVV